MKELQIDADQPLGALAEKLHMAQSTVWRRLKDLEKAGVIRSRVALVDPAKVGAKLCVLARVTLEDHSEAAIEGFSALVRAQPEILECMKISGEADYTLKIRAADVEAYEEFQTKVLLRSDYVRAIQSSFVLKEVKSTTALPL